VGTYTLDSIPSQILSLATESLISTGKDGKPQPNLASHWIVSDDGKTYIVYLKDNLKWHDDSPVSARDISIAISDVKINAINNKTLEFKLPNPISFFPLALDRPVFKSESFYGTGAFRIVDIDQVASIVKKITLLPKDKKLPKEIMAGLLNTKLTKCNIQALILSQEINLPAPIPLPKVQVAAPDKNYIG